MPKKDTLTGGTGDVNPQVFKIPLQIVPFTTAAGVAGAFTASAAVPIPILRLPQKADRAVIMEIVKIRWANGLFLSLPVDSAQNFIVTGTAFIATGPSPFPVGLNPANNVYNPSDSRVVDYVTVTNAVGRTATSLLCFSVDNETPNFHDLTDNDGHGFLVATDQLFIGAQINVLPLDSTVQYTTGFNAQADLFYRFKEVSLKEYIGIVQSQGN